MITRLDESRDINQNTEAFILAGGASVRMGADKANLELGAETFIARIASALSVVARRVRVVSSRHTHELGGCAVIPDLQTQGGALGGLQTALHHAESSWAFVVSCDLPFVTRELFARLVSLRDDALQQDAAFEIVAPRQADGRPQPFCALYRITPCRARVENLLNAGEKRVREMLFVSRTRWVEFAELADLPRSEFFFTNVNTLKDYERAREIYANLL